MNNTVNCPQLSVFTSCLSAMCGVDTNLNGQTYSTNVGDNSSFTVTTNVFTAEDECKIEMKRVNKRRGNTTTRCIEARVTLQDDKIDEQHDLFYLVKLPENPSVVASSNQNRSERQRRDPSPTPRFQDESENLNPQFINFGGKQDTTHHNSQKNHFGGKQEKRKQSLELSDKDLSNLTKYQQDQANSLLNEQAKIVQQNDAGVLCSGEKSQEQQSIKKNKQSSLIIQSGSTAQIKENNYNLNQPTEVPQQTSFTFQPDGGTTSGQNSSSQIVNFATNQTDLGVGGVLGETAKQMATEGTNPSFMASDSLKQLEQQKQLQQSQPNLNKIKTDVISGEESHLLADKSEIKLNLKSQKSDFILQDTQNGKSSQKVTFQALQKQQSDKFLCQNNQNNNHCSAGLNQEKKGGDLLSSISQTNTGGGCNGVSHNQFDHVRRHARLPRTYADLEKRFIVAVQKDKEAKGQNVGLGVFPLSQIPDGKYRIYFFRPKNRDRIIGNNISSMAQDKIQRVGKGQEFYIFEKNSSSQSPSKTSMISSNSLNNPTQQHGNKSQTDQSPKRNQKATRAVQKCHMERHKIEGKPHLRKATSSMVLPETIESITLYNAGKSCNLQNQSSLDDGQTQYEANAFGNGLCNIGDDSSLDTEKVRKLNMNVQIPDLNSVDACELLKRVTSKDEETFMSDLLVNPGAGSQDIQQNTLSVKLAGSNPLQSTISAQNQNEFSNGQNVRQMSGSLESGFQNGEIHFVEATGKIGASEGVEYAGQMTFGDSQGQGRNHTNQQNKFTYNSGESLTQFNEIQMTTLNTQNSKRGKNSSEGIILLSDQDVQVADNRLDNAPILNDKTFSPQKPAANEEVDRTLDIYQTTDKSKDLQAEVQNVFHEDIMLQSVKVCDFDGPLEVDPPCSLSPNKSQNKSNNNPIFVEKQGTDHNCTTTPSQSLLKAENSQKRQNVSKNTQPNNESESSLQILNSMSPMIRKAPNFSSQTKNSTSLSKPINQDDLGPLQKFSPVMVENFQSSGSKDRLVTSAFEAAQIKVYQGQGESSSDYLLRQAQSSSNMRGSPAEMHNASSLLVEELNTNKDADLINELHLQIGLPIDTDQNKQRVENLIEQGDSQKTECNKEQVEFYTQLLQTKSSTALPHKQFHHQILVQSENEMSEVERKHSRAINPAKSQSELFGSEKSEINFFEVCQIDREENGERDNFQNPTDNSQMIRDLLTQKQQEGNQLPFEQLTRNNTESAESETSHDQLNENQNKHIHSGYKQLSTVEEENASQCSDLTSSFQHKQLFQSHNNLSLSRKSLKGSLQLQMSNGTPKKDVAEDQKGFRVGTDLRSFSIAEEVCESENVSQHHQVILSGENTLLIAAPAISKLSLQEEDESLTSSISAQKDGNFNVGSGGCLSGATTKPGSKMASTGALSTNYHLTNKDILPPYVGHNKLQNSSIEISQNNSLETSNSAGVHGGSALALTGLLQNISISQCAQQVKIEDKITSLTKDQTLQPAEQNFVASHVYQSNISAQLMPQNDAISPPNVAINRPLSNTNRHSCQTQSSNPYGIGIIAGRESDNGLDSQSNIQNGEKTFFMRKREQVMMPESSTSIDQNNYQSGEATNHYGEGGIIQESIESIQKMTGTPDSKQDDSAIIKMINDIPNPEESRHYLLQDAVPNNKGVNQHEMLLNSDLNINQASNKEEKRINKDALSYQKQSLASILSNSGRPRSQKLSKKKSKENMKNLFSTQKRKGVTRGRESPTTLGQSQFSQQGSKKASQTPKTAIEKTKSVQGLYGQNTFAGPLAGSKILTPLLKKMGGSSMAAAQIPPIQNPKAKKSSQRVLNLNQLTQLKQDGTSLKFLQKVAPNSQNFPPQPVIKKELTQKQLESQLGMPIGTIVDRNSITKTASKMSQNKQKTLQKNQTHD